MHVRSRVGYPWAYRWPQEHHGADRGDKDGPGEEPKDEAKDYFNKVMAIPLTHEMPKSILIEETGTYLYTILEGKNRTKKLKNIVNKQKSTS